MSYPPQPYYLATRAPGEKAWAISGFSTKRAVQLAGDAINHESLEIEVIVATCLTARLLTDELAGSFLPPPEMVEGSPASAELRQMGILVAWQAAVLSEGAAAQLLGVDRIEARRMLQQVLADVGPAWSEYRAEHPVSIGEEE